MALYNLTGIIEGNETGLLTIVQGINTELMAGLLGALFLIGVTLILLISFIHTTNDVGKSVTAASFIAFTLALPLTALDLLHPLGLFLALVITAASVATTWDKV